MLAEWEQFVVWHFTEIDNDSRIITDPAGLTVQSHGELTQLQIFVREVLQNSLDNRAGKEPVQVDFRLKSIRGAEKAAFLEAIHFREIIPHLESVIQYQKRRKHSSEFSDPASLFEKQYKLKLLYIEDYNTRGLIGPEHSREANKFRPPHCFLGLCRNIGDSQKGPETMGGTYGLGKTVLWKNSRLRLVLFHSRMIDPYISRDKVEHWTRFFGHVRLPGHDMGNQAYKGEGFLGNRSGDVTLSILDDDADQFASRLGMAKRKKNQAGTSILLVDFNDPDVAEDGEDDSATVDRISESSELYYWPAMWDARLRVRARSESEMEDAWKVSPASLPFLSPFIEAYTAAKLNRMRNNLHLIPVEISIPKGPNPQDASVSSKILVCTNLKEEESDTPSEYVNRTAVIRGAGMVVGYQKIGRPGFGGRDFWAVVLGGKSCPDHLSLTEVQRERCELILASAEPVTHDIWTQNSEALKSWRGARAEIVRILNGIKQAITSATSNEIKPEGRASSLLAAMFPLSEGTESDGSRDMAIEVIQPPTLSDSDNGELRYEFQIRIEVPAYESFTELVKPLFWRVECQYGFYGEDVRRRVVENVALEFTHIRKNGTAWQKLPDRKNSYEDFIGIPASYELKGRTQSMESFLASITKHELQVKVFKSY